VNRLTFLSIQLEDLLKRFYEQGVKDAFKIDKDERISFVKLSKELKSEGINITARTLQNRAERNNVKIIKIDGKRNGIYRRDKQSCLNHNGRCFYLSIGSPLQLPIYFLICRDDSLTIIK
jgi:hypothetical protein